MKTLKKIFVAALLTFSYGASAQYCTPTYGPPCTSPGVNDLINNFSTTGGTTNISNLNSGCNMQPNNYIYNAGMPLITAPGALINFTVQSGTPWSQGFSIWVDWNEDLDFDDAGEKVYESPNASTAPFNGSFTIPAVSSCTTYRMRVRCEYAQGGATINPCDYNYYGECEDYPIIIENCEPTICEGETTTLDFSSQVSGVVTGYSWSPTTGVSDPLGGPIVDVSPVDTILYNVTVTTTTGAYVIALPVNVVPMVLPDAGIDDSLCHDLANGAQLTGALSPNNTGASFWQLGSAVTNSGGPGNAVFTAANTDLSPIATANLSGYYEYILFQEDEYLVCPDGSDTVFVYYSEENHTTVLTDPLCFGNADGEIDIVSDASGLSGGLGGNSYSIDGITFQAGSTFSGLLAGTYTVVSEDYLGCQFSSTVDLVDPAAITMDPAFDIVICQNGSATLVAAGNNAPVGGTYTYTWSAGTSTTGTNVITPTPAGTDMSVDVFATTDLGCVSDVVTYNITHHAPISLVITANDSICPGYDAAQTVTATGGYLAGLTDYNYAWTANGTSTADMNAEININPAANTTYCVTVSDGCETTPQTICTDVIMRNVPNPLFTSDLTWGCNPTDITFSNSTDPMDSDSITWLIDGIHYYNEDPLVITFDEVGTYDVWLEVYSEYGCFSSINAVDYIEIHDVPEALFYVNPNPTTIFDTGVEMNNVTPGLGSTYQWQFPGGSPASSNLESPSVYYPEGVVGDYPVELMVTNQWGCSDSVSTSVHVVSDVIIYAPSIFTPDGDEFNESWRVYIDGIDIYDYHLTMFNRWGEPVWESYNQIAEWKGSYGPDGVEDGTFVWLLECKEISTDKKYEFRGHVTVLK
ncbi:MAG: gliding motility-associated-like protein [Arenicella sp.]|jgi:gliding motility-associated-like protein